MIKYIVIIATVFLIKLSNSYSSELNGIFLPEDNKDITIDLGTPFNAILELYPIENTNYRSIVEGLEGKNIASAFYVSEVKEVRISKNNNDVLELRLRVVFENYYNKNLPFHILNIGDLNIPVEIRNIDYIKLKNEEPTLKEFKVYNQKGSYLESSHYIVSLIIAILLALSLWPVIKIYSKKRKKKLEHQVFIVEKHRWHEIISNADQRRDYEFIHRERACWVEFASIETNIINDLLKYIDDIQYKNEWSDTDYLQLSYMRDEVIKLIV